mgnify:CR=1 FL=1
MPVLYIFSPQKIARLVSRELKNQIVVGAGNPEGKISGESETGAGQEIDFMLALIKNSTLAIEITKVLEVIEGFEVTPLYKVSDYIRGLINLRGQVLACIDLAQYLGYDFTETEQWEKALNCFQISEERDNNAYAQSWLGTIYAKGYGVPINYKLAFKWTSLAAEQGDANSQYNLGQMYRKGQGVKQDYKAAVKWYKLSAEQGYAKAQVNLGVMYYNGQGVLADFVLAHMWFNISAALGDEMGDEKRELIAKEMTSEDLSKAEAMARACFNSNYEKCGY